MAKLFRIVFIGNDLEEARELALSFTPEAEDLGTTYRFRFEDWKIAVKITFPGSDVKLPKIIDAFVVNLRNPPSEELKAYLTQFDGVVHRLGALDETEDFPIASSLGLKITKLEILRDYFPTLLKLDAELTDLIKAEFTTFDQDSSGFIDLNELRHISQKLGQNLSDEELQLAMADLDTNKDGKISIEEFTYWWKSGRKGRTLAMRKLIRGVAKVKHLLDSKYAEVAKLTEVVEQKKYIKADLAINHGVVSETNFGFNLEAYNYATEFREAADALNPQEEKSFYFQLVFNTSSPDSFAKAFKKLYEIIVGEFGEIDDFDEEILTDAKLDVTEAEDKVIANFSSPSAFRILGEILEEVDFDSFKNYFILPQLQQSAQFTFNSSVDISAGLAVILQNGFNLRIKAKLTQLIQEVWLEFFSNMTGEGFDNEALIQTVLFGLIKSAHFDLSTHLIKKNPLVKQALEISEEPLEEVKGMLGGFVENFPEALENLNALIEAGTGQATVIAALDIVTVSAEIFAPNVGKLLEQLEGNSD
mmetsp:Transcript_15716/g.28723  ORF Transcript_15716/g.28723 Transcript_15716/m.28723 type:complete len:532 (+) Transcript_15716:99-1694(+)